MTERKFFVILNTDTEQAEGDEFEYEFPYRHLQMVLDTLGTLEVELNKKQKLEKVE